MAADDTPSQSEDDADDRSAARPDEDSEPDSGAEAQAEDDPADAKGEEETPARDTSDRRVAARIATLVAVPVTIAAAAGAFAFTGSIDDGATAEESPQEQNLTAVEAEVPDLSEDDAKVCRALVTEIPEKLGDLPQRPVTGDEGVAEVAAAWGDPAAVMRCGVEEVDVPDTAEVYRLGESCWLAEEGEDETVWTTVDRELPVELTIPEAHDAPGELAQGLSQPVGDKVSAIESAPSGCSG